MKVRRKLPQRRDVKTPKTWFDPPTPRLHGAVAGAFTAVVGGGCFLPMFRPFGIETWAQLGGLVDFAAAYVKHPFGGLLIGSAVPIPVFFSSSAPVDPRVRVYLFVGATTGLAGTLAANFVRKYSTSPRPD